MRKFVQLICLVLSILKASFSQKESHNRVRNFQISLKEIDDIRHDSIENHKQNDRTRKVSLNVKILPLNSQNPRQNGENASIKKLIDRYFNEQRFIHLCPRICSF